MTPEQAARVLGVAVDAPPAAVAAAFAQRARATHPDVAPDRAAEFREAVEARDVLLRTARGGAAPEPPRIVRVDGPQPQGPLLLAAWVALLLVAAFLAIYRVPHPFTVAEPLLRWAVLIAAALAFALTAHRAAMVVTVIAVVATVGMTVVVTSFGGLVGMLVMLPALLGLFTAGIARRRLAERQRTAA